MDSSKALRRHQADVGAFARSLASLCELLEQEPTFNGDGTWFPRTGEEARAAERAREVDRLSGRAAHGLHAAGSFVEWKPRGTWNTRPVNPATAWRTIIDSDPMFPPSVIFACCEQATGILEMKAEHAEEREASVGAKLESAFGFWQRIRGGPGEPGRYAPIIVTAVMSVAGALFTAWLSYKFGWIGEKSPSEGIGGNHRWRSS